MSSSEPAFWRGLQHYLVSAIGNAEETYLLAERVSNVINQLEARRVRLRGQSRAESEFLRHVTRELSVAVNDIECAYLLEDRVAGVITEVDVHLHGERLVPFAEPVSEPVRQSQIDTIDPWAGVTTGLDVNQHLNVYLLQRLRSFEATVGFLTSRTSILVAVWVAGAVALTSDYLSLAEPVHWLLGWTVVACAAWMHWTSASGRKNRLVAKSPIFQQFLQACRATSAVLFTIAIKLLLEVAMRFGRPS